MKEMFIDCVKRDFARYNQLCFLNLLVHCTCLALSGLKTNYKSKLLIKINSDPVWLICFLYKVRVFYFRVWSLSMYMY